METVKSATTPSRARYHHGDLRNALLDVALRLIAERGPEGFSLREAAREVGVSPGAAYRHFADKEALFLAVAEDGHGRLASSMERAIDRLASRPGSKPRAVAALTAIGESYVEFAVRHPSHFRVMFGPCTKAADFAPACAPSGRDPFQILVHALDALVAAGAVQAQERVGAEIAAWSCVHGLAALLVEGAVDLPAQGRAQAVRLLCRTLLLGLGCDPALVPLPPPPSTSIHARP